MVRSSIGDLLTEYGVRVVQEARQRRKEVQIELPDNLAAADAATVVRAGAELRALQLTGTADGVDAPAMTLRECRASGVSFAAANMERLDGRELIFDRCTFTGAKLPRLAIHRTLFRGCRMTGVDIPDGSLTDVVFEDCKLDVASFRFTRLKRVLFRDCILTEVDLGGATATAVRFERCDLGRAQLSHARLAGCDLRTCGLTGVIGVTSLRGAIISEEQLLDLAPVFAADLGLDVRAHDGAA